MKATPEELAEITACAASMRAVVERTGNEEDNYFDYGAKDLELHRLIARASHNAPLATLLDAILPMIMEGRFALVSSFGDAEGFFRRRWVGKIHDEHVGFIDAIKRHDVDAAGYLMNVHMADSIAFFSNIEELYRTVEPPPRDGG